MTLDEILERLREIQNLEEDAEVVLNAVDRLVAEIERELLLNAGTRK